jgi:hypothetical protein
MLSQKIAPYLSGTKTEDPFTEDENTAAIRIFQDLVCSMNIFTATRGD